MLAGKNRVAEIGCGDGWYSQVVAREVEWLDLFDFDSEILAECSRSVKNKTRIFDENIHIHHHDITKGDIRYDYQSGKYDAIYSLDVMEHINPIQEYKYISNICKSLKPEGIFIVGMPSLESQKYASPASKIGHINCKSGEDLRAILLRDYHNVLLFSMHDEVISTAFNKMAHYLFAICIGVRT